MPATASEVDPYTYDFVPLEDAAPAVNERLNHFLIATLTEVNRRLIAGTGDPRQLSDLELEFRFFRRFRDRHIDDVAYGLFEKCVASNRCEGWPHFQRIQMRPQESIFGAADWRYIPSRFYIASLVEVCGVRMGTDKLTHFFDDAFRYFNALRSRRLGYDMQSIGRLSLAFERSYMGTNVTGVVSRADAHANLAGVRFYLDVFAGEEPIVRRDEQGLLVFARPVDICHYVDENFDERMLPNEYVYGSIESDSARQRRTALREAIAERRAISRYIEDNVPEELQRELHREVRGRRYPEPSWQEDLPRHRLALHAVKFIALFAVKPDFREAALLFSGDPYHPDRLEDRKPVEMKPWRDPGQLADSTDTHP